MAQPGHSSYSPGCRSFRRPRSPRVSVALRAVPQTRLRGAGGPATREGCSSFPPPFLLSPSCCVVAETLQQTPPGPRLRQGGELLTQGRRAASLTHSDVWGVREDIQTTLPLRSPLPGACGSSGPGLLHFPGLACHQELGHSGASPHRSQQGLRRQGWGTR